MTTGEKVAVVVIAVIVGWFFGWHSAIWFISGAGVVRLLSM